MQNQQELYNASKQSHLSSASLDLEELQDQNHVSFKVDQKHDDNINNQKNENDSQNYGENEDPSSKKSFLGLKRELAKYKKLAEERQLQILKEQTKSREISSKLDAANLLNQKYENELKSLNEQKEEKDEKNENSPTLQNDESMDAVFSLFEKVQEADKEELSQLSAQRLDMFRICHSYQQCLEAADNEIQSIKSQIQSHDNENFSNLLNDIQKITQSTNKEENDQSARDTILTIVQELYDNSISQQKTQKSNENSKSNGQILGHLENALYFIRTLKNSSPDEESPLKDKELRKAINQQCKQIESFLSENKPEAVTSLFDNSNVDEQLKTFFDFIDENEKTESPFRELYSLFTAVIQVNQMLFERNKELKNNTQKSKVQSESLQKELDEVNSNCDQKDEMINELLDQMEKTLEQRPENILSGYNDVCLIIKELMNELAKNKKESEAMNRKYKKIKKSNDSNINEIQTKEKQIKELNEKQARIQKQAEIQKAQLEANITELKKKHQEVSKKVDHHSQKTQKLKDQNKELQTQIDDLQKQNEELNSKIHDLMANEDFTTSTINGFENRVSRMKIKNAKLKKKNNELETQLNKIVEEIKSQNDSLEKTYQDNLQQLSSENEELRAKLDEEKEVNKRNQKWQNEYQTKVAKMKLNEVQRTTELNEAKKSLQMLEQQSDAKLDAQKIAYEELIQKFKQYCDDCALRIASILNEDTSQFEEENENDSDEQNDNENKKLNLDKVIDSIEEKIHPNLIRDAIETKTLLKLNKNDSIHDAVKKLIKGIMHKSKLIKDLEKNNNDLQNIANSITAEELSNWKNWGNKLYSRINGDDEPKPYDSEKTRESIERVLDDLVNPESNERKLEILKNEKLILSKFDNNAIQRKSSEPVESIRVITLAFMLIGRLQSYAQAVQLPYKLRLNNNLNETENDDEEEEEEEIEN